MNKTTLTLGAAAVAVVIGAGALVNNAVFAKSPSPTSKPAPMMEKTLPPTAKGEMKPAESNIVEIVLKEDGEFDVLQAAVVKAGLVDALSGEGQMTVFAPTDAAFIKTLAVADEAAAIAAVEGLPVADLTNILLFHVTEGRRNSQSVLAAPQYPMLNDMMLSQTELTTAGIATTDISASNGIIHVINSVLMPAAK
jgi:uncharacterized surface protein with fasciclin (FAS1) repeats